jgi:N-acetylmuramic acid 6-phosphate (MurNAc-6-P) etherase
MCGGCFTPFKFKSKENANKKEIISLIMKRTECEKEDAQYIYDGSGGNMTDAIRIFDMIKRTECSAYACSQSYKEAKGNIVQALLLLPNYK